MTGQLEQVGLRPIQPTYGPGYETVRQAWDDGRDLAAVRELARQFTEDQRERPLTDREVVRWLVWALIACVVAVFWIGMAWLGVLVWHHWRGAAQLFWCLSTAALVLATMRVTRGRR